MADDTTAALATEPDPTTQTTEPEGDAGGDAGAGNQSAADTGTQTDGAQTDESIDGGEDALSPQDIEFGRLLLSERDEPQLTAADPNTEDGSEQSVRRRGQTEAKPAAQSEASGTFNARELSQLLTEEMGPKGEPIAKILTGQFTAYETKISGLEQRLEEQAEQFDQILKAVEEQGGKIKPIEARLAQQQAKEWAESQRSIHQWFDDRADAGFSDRYGTGDTSKHTTHHAMARNAVFLDAMRMLKAADSKKQPMTMQRALQLADAINFGGQPTKAGAVEAVRGQVRQQSRMQSIDPARGGRSNTPLTPLQERAANVQKVSAILAQAGKR